MVVNVPRYVRNLYLGPLFLAVFGCFWLFLAVFDCYRLFLAVLAGLGLVWAGLGWFANVDKSWMAEELQTSFLAVLISGPDLAPSMTAGR